MIQETTKGLRAQKTKNNIWYSLIKLLKKKNLDEISIQQICEFAGIHRTTFYKYFEDIFMLVEFGVENTIEEVLLDVIYSDIEKISTEHIVEFISQNRIIIRNIYETKYYNVVYRKISTVLEKYLIDALLQSEKEYSLDIPVEMIAKFYGGGFNEILAWWLDKPSISEKEFIVELNKLYKMILNSCST